MKPTEAYRSFLFNETGDRTDVVEPKTGTWLATLTRGAYTVRLAGPWRTFRESATSPASDQDWLAVARYRASSACWPRSTQAGCPDCSGFIRIVYGYRHHVDRKYTDTIPLCLDPRPTRDAVLRRSFQIAESAPPGIVVIEDEGTQADPCALEIGNLVFFEADAAGEEAGRLDHVGLYLGADTGGHHRFFSSRKGADGPTFGDIRGKSILDGSGLYARAFRAARRL